MSKARVMVVVNKWWEFDPVMNVLLHEEARPPAELGGPCVLRHPRPRPNSNALPQENMHPFPRAVYKYPRVDIEMWCISDLLEHLDKAFQSSSQCKAEQLPKIFASQPADLVVAVGTAAYPDEVISRNGSVVVGTNVFMHNCHPIATNPNPYSQWEAGPFDVLKRSALSGDAFATITAMDEVRRGAIVSRFMLVPEIDPKTDIRAILVDYDAVAIGAVNVTDPGEYTTTDTETLGAFGVYCPGEQAKSLETTHGLIRVLGGDAFLFISGITDRFGRFKDEVEKRKYAQNMSVAHNAGVVLAWMLPRVAALY